MKTIAFFNNKGGVGKTALIYHLAYMFAEMGIHTLAVDFDPQANLTAMFLDEDRLEQLWAEKEHPATVFGSIRPILLGLGDIASTQVIQIAPRLGLIPGDFGLAQFEGKLAEAWAGCRNSDESAFRTMTAFHRLIKASADERVEVVLIDIGPDLSAINRATFIAADQIYFPLAPDLFSMHGLQSLGTTLRGWRNKWTNISCTSGFAPSMATGKMRSMGYIVLQHGGIGSHALKSRQSWMGRIPGIFREAILGEEPHAGMGVDSDPYCLALLQHYHSLMPMAMAARKPIFMLKSADGAIGAHSAAVQSFHQDLNKLARKIGVLADIVLV